MTDDSADLAPRVSQASRWIEYELSLRDANRYVPSGPAYVDQCVAECLARAASLEPDTVLYRARIVPPEHEGDEDALPVSALEPPVLAREGRLNPDRIPCFYASREVPTAIAEVRPWPGALVTVARCVTLSRVPIVDLRTRAGQSELLEFIAFRIAYPVHEHDPLRYLGTQYLAERLKARGVAGMMYASARGGGGTNVALFGRDRVWRWEGRSQFFVNEVQVRWTQIGGWLREGQA